MLSVSECASLNCLQTLRSEWSELLGRSDSASAFTSWEWTEANWRYAAPGKKPFVLLARDGQGRLIGVLPLARTSRLRVVHTLEVLGCAPGGYPTGDYGGLVAERGMESAAWAAMLRHLRGSRWSMIDLRNCMLTGGSPETTAYAHAPRSNWGLKLQEVDVCRRIPLAATYDDYLAGLSSNGRQNLRRKVRKLNDDGHRIEVVDTNDEKARNEALEAVFKYHQERWADDPSGGAFPDERSRELHRHLARMLAGTGRLDLRVVRSEQGDIAGVIYNFRQNGTGYFYQLGFSQSEQWKPYSLGVCLLADSIRAAIEAGCTTFDLLRGDHDYKRHFGGDVSHNLRVTVYRYAWLPAAEEAAKKLKRRLRKGSAAHASATA